MFSENFKLVISLEGCRIVLGEALSVKRNGEKFEIKRDVGKCVAVLDTTYYVRSEVEIVKID